MSEYKEAGYSQADLIAKFKAAEAGTESALARQLRSEGVSARMINDAYGRTGKPPAYLFRKSR